MTDLAPVQTSSAVVREPVGLENATVTLVERVDDAYELMRWLSTKKLIGADIEATGLDKDRDHTRLFQISDDRDAWVVPFERWAGVVDDVVNRYEGEYVFHNATYDCALLRHDGVKIPTHRVHDTRLQRHVLSSVDLLALKSLADRFIDPRASLLQQDLEEALGRNGGWTWSTVPITFAPYWRYAGLDPILTYRLHEIFYPQVQREAPLSYDLERSVAWVCDRMERRGARVDRPYTRELHGKLAEFVAESERWCVDNYGVKPGSTDAIVEVLLRDGVRLWKRTPSGEKYSLDKEALVEIAHPLAQAVLNRRRAQKMVSTYLGTYLELSEYDGLIHPSINTVGGTNKNPFESGGGRGVRTGRMSMSDPNLQNVPVRGAMTKRIRRCFIPRDGHTWVKADADQIEMRILASFANDRGMIDAFLSPDDFFLTMTRSIFSDPTIQKNDPRRQTTKNAAYAKIYGAGASKFAKTANILTSDGDPDVAAAAAFLGRFDEMFPGVRAFQRGIEQTAMRTREIEGDAYVRSPLTQRRYVADAGREYTLVNYLIQGVAGEILKMKIVEADAAGLGEFMLYPVHDEINLDVPTEKLADVLVTLTDVLNDDKLLAVPLTWSAEHGPSWAECA